MNKIKTHSLKMTQCVAETIKKADEELVTTTEGQTTIFLYLDHNL